MTKKTDPRRWLALLLALVMLILTGCSGGKKPAEPAPAVTDSVTTAPAEAPANTSEATEIPAATKAPAFVEDESLILYIKDSMLDVGGDGALEITVLCGDGVNENIDVVDDTGAVLAIIENTSGGQQYELTVEVSTQAERVGTLAARTATAESTPRKFYIYPEVTEEMVNRLDDAGENMLEYVTSCDFKDAYSDEAYQQIADWLNQQDYIDYAEINGDGVLFRTADGLMGGYGYQPTEGYLGSADDDSESEAAPDYGIFADPERVFEDWLNGKKSSADLLESQIPITNTNYLVWAGDYEDGTIYQLSNSSLISMMILDYATNGSYDQSKLSTSEEALALLKNGDITDYGFLVLCGHGGAYFTREDDTPFFSFSIADYTYHNLDVLGFDTLYTAMDETQLKKLSSDLMALAVFGIDESTGKQESVGSIHVTEAYMAHVLGDVLFDNTVVMLAICQGMRDPLFYNLLLDHGASAVIGSEEVIGTTNMLAMLYEIVNTLVSIDGNGNYGTLNDALAHYPSEDVFSIEGDFNTCIYESSVKAGAEHLIGYFQNNRADLSANWEIAPIIMRTREMSPAQQEQATVDDPYANRQFLGYGLATGAVIDQRGEPIPAAEVKLYRWLNHDFVQHEVKVEGPIQDGETRDVVPIITNDLGEFTVKNVPYGLYVAYAEKDGNHGYTPFFVQAPGNEVVVEIRDEPFIMTTGVQEYVTTKVSAQIARPTFSLEGNDFVDDLAGMMNALFVETIVAAEDMLSAPIYDGRKHMAIAGVNDIRVTDRYVSVRVSTYQEYSGSAHGMHYWDTYTYWLDTGRPVRLHEILDPGVEQASTRLRSLWRNAIYQKGVTDEALWQPLDITLQEALLGDRVCYWHFTDEGLNLQFPLYEVGPYAVGSLEVTLPYHRLVYVIAPDFLPNDPPDELTVENEPVSASVMPIAFGKDYKHRFQEANEAAAQVGAELPYPVYGTETAGAHLIAVDGSAENFRVYVDPPDYVEPTMLFFASTIENALVWLPDLKDDTFEAVWEADGVTRSVTLKF